MHRYIFLERMSAARVVSCLLSTMLVYPLVFACDVNYTIPYGFTTSPEYPESYPKNQDCRTTILAPENTKIVIIFQEFHLENPSGIMTPTCDDYVKIYPVETGKTGTVIFLCGSSSPGPFYSKNNNITIEFHSDSASEERGFKLYWKFLDRFVYHKDRRTWSEAREQCSKEGGALAKLDSLNYWDIADLWVTYIVKEAWSDSYYSPWMWIKGCLREPFLGQYGNVTNFKNNQAALCVNHCRDSHYFGLKNDLCVCIDWFDGEFKKPQDHCNTACPGNQHEKCGGNSAFTIYMNDICYQNSTTWLGTVSQTILGQRCKPWIELYNSSSDGDFPDGSVKSASNYCRDVTKYDVLGCFDKDGKWIFCDIPKCFDKGTRDQTPSKCLSFHYDGHGNTITKHVSCETQLQYIYLMDKVPQRSTRAYDWTTAWGRFTNHVYVTGFQPLFITGTYWRGFTREHVHLSTIYNADDPTDCFKIITDGATGTLVESPLKCNQSLPYFCQYAASTCGETLTSPNGTFTSPNYPEYYTGYLNCVWNISVTPGLLIQLEFDMDIEDSSGCNSDYIKVYDGNSTFDDVLAIKCGLQNWTISTSSNHVTINFRSDITVSSKGFQAEWRAAHLPLSTDRSVTDSFNQTFNGDTKGESDSTSAWIYIAIAVGAIALLLLLLLIFLKRRCRDRKQLNAGNRGRSSTYAMTSIHQRPSVKPQPNKTNNSKSGVVDSGDLYINSLLNTEGNDYMNGESHGDTRYNDRQKEIEMTYANTLERHGRRAKGLEPANRDDVTHEPSENIYNHTDDTLTLPDQETISMSSGSHLYNTIENARKISEVSEDCVYSRINKENRNKGIVNQNSCDDDTATYDHTPTYNKAGTCKSKTDDDKATYDHAHSYDHIISDKNRNEDTYNHLDGESDYDISNSSGVKEKHVKDPTYNTLSQTVNI